MREALQDFARNGGDTHPEKFTLVPFHTPRPGMVRRAAALGFRHCVRDTEVEEQLADEVGRQPRPEAFDEQETCFEAIKSYTEELRHTSTYQEWYERTVESTDMEPFTTLPRRVRGWGRMGEGEREYSYVE